MLRFSKKALEAKWAKERKVFLRSLTNNSMDMLIGLLDSFWMKCKFLEMQSAMQETLIKEMQDNFQELAQLNKETNVDCKDTGEELIATLKKHNELIKYTKSIIEQQNYNRLVKEENFRKVQAEANRKRKAKSIELEEQLTVCIRDCLNKDPDAANKKLESIASRAGFEGSNAYTAKTLTKKVATIAARLRNEFSDQ